MFKKLLILGMLVASLFGSVRELTEKNFNKAIARDAVVVEYALGRAYPNPFNPTTTIDYSIVDAGHVTVKIYNVVGQHVATLADGYMERSASGYTLNWNASQMPSGVYLVKAETASSVSTQKLMLLK